MRERGGNPLSNLGPRPQFEAYHCDPDNAAECDRRGFEARLRRLRWGWRPKNLVDVSSALLHLRTFGSHIEGLQKRNPNAQTFIDALPCRPEPTFFSKALQMSDNDSPQLTPANENPWYWLATLHGEQGEEGWNTKLAERNRVAWNRWMANALDEEQRNNLVDSGVAIAELTPLSKDEQQEFLKSFAERAGREDTNPLDWDQTIDLSNLRFEYPVFFSGFIFPRFVNFSDVTFVRSVVFSRAIFVQAVSFRRAFFSRGAHFDGATFFDGAAFTKATFSTRAGFMAATFSGTAFFDDVTFSYEGYNNYTISPDFSKARFSTIALFSNAIFSNQTSFENAAFSGPSSFVASKFKSYTNFANLRLESAVPDFRGAKLHEATEWHGTSWPTPPKDKAEAQKQIYAYECLKAEMERVKRHEDEQFFFAKELRARRALERPGSPKWLLNYAYEQLSGYGLSVERPILWLSALFVLGVFVFSLVDGCLDAWSAAGLSAANLFSFLPYKPDKSVTDHLSTSARIIGDAQAVFGLPLLFLLGLALRNRFRMR